MNIVLFRAIANCPIGKFPNGLKSHVENRLVKRFACENISQYTQKVQQHWNNLPYQDLVSIFNENELFASNRTKHIDYFVFLDQSVPLDSSELSLHILCIFDNENVSKSIFTVIKNIKRLVSDKIEFRIKTEPIMSDPIYLFPYRDGDIVDTSTRVKAGFNESKYDNKGAAIRDLAILISTIVCFVLWITVNKKNFQDAFMGAFITGLTYLLSEITLYWASPKYKISISDLNSPITEHPNFAQPQEDEEEIATPQVNP